jgi:cation diffusion facilitator family transporter
VTIDLSGGDDVHAHAHAHAHGESCSGHEHSHAHEHAHAHAHAHSDAPAAAASNGKKKGGGSGGDVVGVLSFAVRGVVRGDKALKLLALFAVCFGAVSVAELAFGLLNGSLAMLADACHMLYMCSALLIRIASRGVEHMPPSPHYSYGVRRLEVLLSFCAGASAMFVSLMIVFESLEHWLHAPVVGGEQLLTVAVVGLAAKIVGVLFFYEFMRPRTESLLTYDARDDQWRHVVVDAICSLAVMFNAWLVQWHDGMMADFVIAFLLAWLLMFTALPVCVRAGLVLLQVTPAVRRDEIDVAMRDILLLDGVSECRAEHFWTLSPGVCAGSITVGVRANADRALVLDRVRKVLAPLIQHLAVQIETEEMRFATAAAAAAVPAAAPTSAHAGHGHAHAHGETCSGGHH